MDSQEFQQYDSNLDILDSEIMKTFPANMNANEVIQLPNHFDQLPNLVPVRSNSYEFDVVVPPDNKEWYYNPDTSKLFIKMNSTFTINASYKPTSRDQILFLRAMILFSSPSEMHIPVKRCANHRLSNSEEAQAHNVIKSNHPKAFYYGTENGKIFSERLSVVIPIDFTKYDENGMISESFSYEFGCQNSCSSGMNRRATAIVFTLEDNNYNLLGKRCVSFKVCSCPKRDKDREMQELKRKSGATDGFPHGKRPKMPTQPATATATATATTTIKTEPDDPSSENDEQMPPAVETTTLKIKIPTEFTDSVLKYVHDILAGKMAETKTDNYISFMREIQKQRKKYANQQQNINN